MDPVRVTVGELAGLRRAAQALRLWPQPRFATGSGEHALFRGRGMEFAESRAYQPGDDIRALDWRVTARTGRPHTKLFHEERERPVLIGVDLRRAMFFATRGQFKSTLAARIAALLAWAAFDHRDRLGGFVMTAAGLAEFKPRHSRQAVLQWLGALAEMTQGPASATATPVDSMTEWLLALRRAVRPGSLIFLLSDFRGWDATAEQHLAGVTAHSDLCLGLIHDPLESRLPPPGRYAICDPDGRRAVVHGGATPAARLYAGRFEQRRAALVRFALAHRASLLEFPTTADPLRVLGAGIGLRLSKTHS